MTSLKTPVLTGPQITWEPLPDDFILPDEPVENIDHPLIAAALREGLEIEGLIGAAALIASNFGICATVGGKLVVKAPDWVYVPQVHPTSKTRRSYTPNLEGEMPAVVMEFLSDNDGGEYSMNAKYPFGKWWFYERILQVPVYVIFVPETGELEFYRLVGGRYEQQPQPENNRYWIEEMQLFLGVWLGTKSNRTGYWLRWWDTQGNLLLWGTERVQQEQQQKELALQQAEQERQQKELALQQAEQERQQKELAVQLAEQEKLKSQRLIEKLKAFGVDAEDEIS